MPTDDFSVSLSVTPRIKFWMPDIGLREIKGSLSLENGLLVIDVTDSLMGEWDKDQQLIKIEYDALNEIGIAKGFVYDKLIIRPKRAQLLEMIPGEHPVDLELKVWRTKRKQLQELVKQFWLGS